ncbi:ATP-dependent helicase [Actibacterium mucosum KCTC 23349]|uniref:ATP-dependent helicase n=1 Tax=Actibacterium mucosum KCTC 23349 TaxID=1454373 RepID=A0A037ZI85_9RHOB|nr:ATP-dependent helicase HrpB [Actibacterium mucosum]KAJ56160.1 ATP-dependent helicase [Actibacterium mucosum KCTC 23349]
MSFALPIDDALPDLIAALRDAGRAVLQAPPGAGKTTRVPLAMLQAGLCAGRIVMLEPRRLAARAAAERMAQTLGEKVGDRVGYRIRGEARVGPDTRIEVVTEGILTRMLQSDPSLEGVGAVIFDEFHERSLNADLGLALTWEAREALRDDLLVVVMSATLDAGPVAAMLNNAPVITSEGRAFPVETRWLDAPLRKEVRREAAMADLIVSALRETKGGVLAFLPGEGEIRRVAAALDGRLPGNVALMPLYGALPFAKQQAAIRPLKGDVRKLVLATSIAETSLTIQDVRVVVDGGQSRRARFDPGSGMSRLVTEKVSRAEAEQRRGRAGRVAEGWCYRLWTRGEEGALAAFPPAEIEAADLSDLALELAIWGAEPGELAFLTPPPEGALAEARALLAQLGALAGGRITDHGRALGALPLHPRLGHMLLRAGADAAPLAALLGERDPLRDGGSDLTRRLRAIDGRGAGDAKTLARIRDEAKRLRRLAPRGDFPKRSAAAMAALAYPDRVALRRKGDAARYVMSGGKGAVMADHDTLAGQRMIVAATLDGNPREARIRLAAALSEAELRGEFADQITWDNACHWSKRDRRVLARRQERFGALVLADEAWKGAPSEAIAGAMADGVRTLGLSWSDAARRFAARARLMQDGDDTFPDLSDAALMATLDDWLVPHLGGVRSAEGWKNFDMLPALRAMLNWDQMARLDREVPAHWQTPLGRKLPIDYGDGQPAVQAKLQEFLGVTRHPTVGPAQVPLKVTMLSPAQRPIQITTDIPGFWAGSYADLRKDMRAQYPKHVWPEDPANEKPTTRAKPRR